MEVRINVSHADPARSVHLRHRICGKVEITIHLNVGRAWKSLWELIGDLRNHVVRAQSLRLALQYTHQRPRKGPVILVVWIQGLHSGLVRPRGSKDNRVAVLRNLLPFGLFIRSGSVTVAGLLLFSAATSRSS